MNKQELRYQLTASLSQLYDIEAFSHLAEFLQGELHVLYFLSQNSKEEINPSILSDKLHVSRSRITAALSALRKKGFVTMELCEDDRRRMRVKITPEGDIYIKGKQQRVERYFDMLVEGLEEVNTKDLIRLIDLSINIMGNKETHS